MFETPSPSSAASSPTFAAGSSADQEVISFRVASNSRRRTGEGTWEPGNSLYITVNCWGKLVTGVGAGLYKGAPVIVVGNVYTSEYEDKRRDRAVVAGDARHRRRAGPVPGHRPHRAAPADAGRGRRSHPERVPDDGAETPWRDRRRRRRPAMARWRCAA